MLELVGVKLQIQWRQIGLGLGLKQPELDVIQQTNRNSINAELDCITRVFDRWHDGVTSEYSWKKLAEVMCSPLLMKQGMLADMHSKLSKK